MKQPMAHSRQLVLPTLEEQRMLLARLRPLTATIEWICRRGVDVDPVMAYLSDHSPKVSHGVTPRPGYERGDGKAVVLTCKYHRSFFGVWNDEGLFEAVRSPRGDHVRPASLGFVDVCWYGDRASLLAASVTHAGIIHEFDATPLL